jgi:hypothetical protein
MIILKRQQLGFQIGTNRIVARIADCDLQFQGRPDGSNDVVEGHTLAWSITAEVGSMCSLSPFSARVRPICMAIFVTQLFQVSCSIAKLCIVKNVHELVYVVYGSISMSLQHNLS